MRVAVVILAGGEGRRIGGGKPLRELAGRTLIDRALDLAKDWSDEIAIAVHHPAQIGSVAVPLLIDWEEAGPISGVANALDFAAERGAAAVLTISCDTPLLPADLLTKLSEALAPEIGAAVPVSDGRIHPSCALWRIAVRDLLPDYLRSGRSSLRGLAIEAGHAEIEWPIQPYDPFFNVNREEDLATAERLLKSR